MAGSEPAIHRHERRSTTRRVVERFYSVELKIRDLLVVYHCKLRDVSARGLCILVREASPIAGALKPGDQLTMRFFPADGRSAPVPLITRIAHVTPQSRGRYRGHCLVGLEILSDPADVSGRLIGERGDEAPAAERFIPAQTPPEA